MPRIRYRLSFGFIVLSLVLWSPRAAEASLPIIGLQETISGDGTASGWAVDPDALSEAIFVHFYLDGPAGTGRFIGFVKADIPRLGLGYPGSHGFQFSIPSEYRDSRFHTLTAYGIDTSGIAAENLLLAGSPLGFLLNSFVIHLPVTGLLETVTPDGTAIGWAVDSDALSTSIAVHFYLDGPAGTGRFIGSVTADTSDFTGFHGFRFSIPSQYKDGQVHLLSAYGIDTSGLPSENLLLPGSPQAFRLDPPGGHAPVTGWFETITPDGTAVGWAVDPDAASSSIPVHFYLDGPVGTGQFIGSVMADTPRPDLPYPGSHGFTFPIPVQYRDRQTHTLTVYGIATSGVAIENIPLSGGPQTFRLDAPVLSLPVIGRLESISDEGIAAGWALDPDAPSSSIDVHFYVDGAPGIGQFVASRPANIPREDLLYAGLHGFRFSIPSRYRDGLPHTLTIYGIDTSGIGANHSALQGGPSTFRLNSTVVRLDNGFIRVGVEPRCGGALVELSLQGKNLINNFDCTGRQVQTAFYDANQFYDNCGGCTGIWGWNPVQGGDKYEFGSPLTGMSMNSNSVYIVTQPYEWNPNDKGGGAGRPVLSDMVIEQWVSFMPENPYGIRLHYRIWHLGSDTHANSPQEFPAVFVNRGYEHFLHYRGMMPWTDDTVTADGLGPPQQPMLPRYSSERWAALVNDAGAGLTVYVPQQYPYTAGLQMAGGSGEYDFGANYFRPLVPFTFGPGSMMEGDVYLIAGDYRDARRTVYQLEKTAVTPDTLPPFGDLDTPSANLTVTQNLIVRGWAFDNTRVAGVDVLVDGQLAGSAFYGTNRSDVAITYPHAPSQIGFRYTLDTKRYANGPHFVSVRASDDAGNTAVIRGAWVLVNN